MAVKPPIAPSFPNINNNAGHLIPREAWATTANKRPRHQPLVGASLLAMDVNDNAGVPDTPRGLSDHREQARSYNATRLVPPDTTLAAIPSAHDPCRINLFIASHPPAGL